MSDRVCIAGDPEAASSGGPPSPSARQAVDTPEAATRRERRHDDAATADRVGRGRRAVLEAAVAFGSGAGSFALLALVLATAHSTVVAVVIGVASVAAIGAVTRAWGIAYAAPAAMAGLLAYDWFEFAPTHPAALPGWGDLGDLLTYLTIAAFVGVLAARASRRAVASDVARAELAYEHEALRRVSTLVAQGRPSEDVFAAVAQELGGVLRGLRIDTTMVCYDADGVAVVVAASGAGSSVTVGARLPLDEDGVAARVRRTGRPARIDDYGTVAGAVGAHMRAQGVRSAVGVPIVVHGAVWGAMITATDQPEPLPLGTEARVAEFTELVATAISNVQARADLAASRARVVAAAHEERRRAVRDLHDGAQQRLVHTVVTLKLARRALAGGQDAAPALVAEALRHAERATAELRELVHGVMPAELTRGGLRAGVGALATRAAVPVTVDVSADRLPATTEATAYFVVAEALTNVAKHSSARRAAVTARVRDGVLRVEVRDDGVGGARPEGSGLAGLAERLALLDGELRVESPAGGGTLVAATIPVRPPQPPERTIGER